METALVTCCDRFGTLIQSVPMDSLQSLIVRTRSGDEDAYGEIVRRVQDMAVGYGYAMLRDFQSAEDAAQEAFLEAYRSLSS
jgi:DNA-directed RNA polymerase specialized sigma24 family protein